ncbi:MAG TPA: BTAD domain-containing putative transcriptional regulator [Thermoanaerobaculia bacterium]|jgi:non-specific serine/threonine protein kinase|nr:BTAD domain-containing putative transcriptional regulator [Thermoanaerobaculia bacterium]
MPTLPVALTPLLGRARELAETQALLESTRLLTITGAGGSGKTRMALELAHRVSERYDDAAWVDLAPLTDPELIAQQMLTALGIRELPTQDVTTFVIDTVRDRAILFVLDNCEHVVDAAAMVAEEVLRSCPNTKIVATSRQPLGISGEQTWLVPPLSDEDAVQLFTERARAVAPSFKPTDVVTQICRRLDGIPLAIELAAARVKVLTVDQIAERLDDAFKLLSAGSRTLPRHRTIRETIDWSYRLLSENEQVLLRRLGIFGGSFPLDAAEAICGENVMELLSALVDKSLVLFENDQYRLLDTVRQFAAEKLEQSGEQDALREKHARWFVSLVESLEPHIFAGSSDPQAMARLDEQIGNIRAVFDRARDPELELRLVYALHWYWFARGHFHEARRRITAALEHAEHVDDVLRARALVAAGHAAVWQGDFHALRPMIDEAVSTLRTGREAASAWMLLGTSFAFAENDHEGAQNAFNRAEDIARQNGSDIALALTLYWSGLAAQLRGDLKSARAKFEEARDVGEATGNPPAIAHPLTVLGHLALRERKLDEALSCFRRALDIFSAIDDRWGLTQVVEGIGLALLDTRDPETGTRLLAAASAAWLHMGASPGRHEESEREKDERIREALGSDRLRVVLASGAAMSYDQMVALARERIEQTAATPVIRVRALGPVEVRRGDLLLDVGSQREMLLFLLGHPNGATKEQIGAALWPDADPAKLRNNFHVNTHRLRKALGGSDWVVVKGETYSMKPGIDFDAATFERDANSALRARDAARLARAIELYRGDFFENATSGEWHLEIRDRLRELYARSLSALAKLTNDAEVWQKLVELDALDEEAARNLMKTLIERGYAAGANRVYLRLVDALRRELDVEPEPETVAIATRSREKR